MADNKKAESNTPAKWPSHYCVFGADLSLKRPGFCLAEIRRQKDQTKIVKITTASVDNKTKTKPHGQLLSETAQMLTEYLSNIALPTYFVREHAFSGRGAASDQGIFEAVGVSNMILWQTQHQTWIELYPVSIKKLLTGSGKATKEDVAKAVQEVLDQKIDFACDDESDACAVVLAWLLQAGQLPQKSQ